MAEYPSDIVKVRTLWNRNKWRDACIRASTHLYPGTLWAFENTGRHQSQCWNGGVLIGDWSLGSGWVRDIEHLDPAI